jgi:2-polyprenyl-6-methoxyphenol hydroxylase-like FAD-dependent oxidoreductase
MHGIMLKSLGHDVSILEKSPGSSPESHMAGVCIASDVLSFLERFDKLKDQPLGIPSVCLQSIDDNNNISVFLRVHRLMTSWDALYFRLRANFDGLSSEYHQNPPQTDQSNGCSVAYESGKQVVSLEDTGSTVRVGYQDLVSGSISNSTADLVLVADGPNSIMRNFFLPTVQRRYAGYIAWRGVVSENEVSEETRNIFQRNITYLIVRGGHAIM